LLEPESGNKRCVPSTSKNATTLGYRLRAYVLDQRSDGQDHQNEDKQHPNPADAYGCTKFNAAKP
jgi:hypothetical protein